MVEKWRLIIDKHRTGAENMAIDEGILLAVGQGLVLPTIRFYTWSPPAVSLGYFQSLSKEVDTAYCLKNGIDVVRRLSGGRAVLHQHELTYSLVAPEKNALVAGSVIRSYLAISRGLVKGLTEFGVQAEMSERKKQSKVGSAACFDAPSWYEIVVQGKKIVGSAQIRNQGMLLQHGSILLDLDVDLLFSVLKFDDEKMRDRAKNYFLAKATSLREVLGCQPDLNSLCHCLIKGFESEMNIEFSEETLSDSEIELTQDLYQRKYNSETWNNRK